MGEHDEGNMFSFVVAVSENYIWLHLTIEYGLEKDKTKRTSKSIVHSSKQTVPEKDIWEKRMNANDIVIICPGHIPSCL